MEPENAYYRYHCANCDFTVYAHACLGCVCCASCRLGLQRPVDATHFDDIPRGTFVLAADLMVRGDG